MTAIPAAPSVTAGPRRRTDVALLILRVVVGIVFVAHGAQKLFVWGHAGTAGAFAQMGLPMPAVAAFYATWVELLGGIALIPGIVTRIAAVLLAIDMLGAIVFVHMKNGFFLPNGAEHALTLLAAAVALAIGGPGAWALDDLRGGARRDTAA